MKLFSNFDTGQKIRVFKKLQQELGVDKVFLVEKSRLFWFLKIFVPMLIYSTVLIVFILFLYKVFFNYNVKYVVVSLILAVYIMFLISMISNYIRYKMNYLIATTSYIIKYSQYGLFHRDITTLNTKNIKTITITKSWFRYSLFNTWDITFLSEWDLEKWEIIVHYVRKPEKVRYSIMEILWKV